jgi:hypothetical protein
LQSIPSILSNVKGTITGGTTAIWLTFKT